MEKVVLKATKRSVTGKQVNALRRAGKLPAVIYGRHVEPVNIALDAHSAMLVLGKTTSSSLVTIELDGKQLPTLVREKQRDFIRGNLLHVDFLAVSMTEKIRATVGIDLTGMAPAVKDFNAVLVNGLSELEIECLPSDLPERVTVDLSGLAMIGDGLYVRDVALPDKVKVLSSPDEMIVIATAPKVEEIVEEAAPQAEAEAVEPELSVERGKKEEEAPEEGEAKKPEKGEKGE